MYEVYIVRYKKRNVRRVFTEKCAYTLGGELNCQYTVIAEAEVELKS